MRVYFQAYNGKIWSSSNDTQYIIEINLAPAPTCDVTELEVASLTGPISTISESGPSTYTLTPGEGQELIVSFAVEIT